MLPIQNNVPVPPIDYGTKKRTRYAFENMAVGEMIFDPDKSPKQVKGYVAAVAKKLGLTFTVRQAHMRATSATTWEPCDKANPAARKGVGIWRMT